MTIILMALLLLPTIMESIITDCPSLIKWFLYFPFLISKRIVARGDAIVDQNSVNFWWTLWWGWNNISNGPKREILFEITTNTFTNLDKCILQWRQIPLAMDSEWGWNKSIGPRRERLFDFEWGIYSVQIQNLYLYYKYNYAKTLLLGRNTSSNRPEIYI